MRKLSAFSVILVFVVLMVIGIGVTPLLNVQFTPSKKGSSLNISYNWYGASAKVIELEVTSKIEGLVSSIKGVRDVSSVSRKNGGRVTVTLKDADDAKNIKFEISQLLRQVYKKLPEGCSYPFVSGASYGTSESPILSFTVNANLTPTEIEEYANDKIIKEISLIDGVNKVDLYGATPKYVEVIYNPQILNSLGLNGNDVSSAIRNSLADNRLVGSINEVGILLKCDAEYFGLEDIPIKEVDGRIVRVKDVARISLKERLPNSYYRINGLNTINITVYPEKYVNTLEVSKKVKEKMEILKTSFPDNFSVITSYDTSIELKEEIRKIVVRTILSLLILLLFVLVVSRSFKYLFVIAFALAANIFIAFIFYVIFNLEIHLYSMAGITVSLGIIIDTSIIMISHYAYYKNRKVFIAILAAQLTSIGALIVIYLLPEAQKANLIDFSGVIIINLAISLLISMLLIPAVVDKFGVGEKRDGLSGRKKQLFSKRLVVKFNNGYKRYIEFFKKYKWISFVLLILGFGLPVDLLPDNLEKKENVWSNNEQVKKKEKFGVRLYNSTLGSEFFVKKIKPVASVALGGSLRLFTSNTNSFSFDRNPARPELFILASLPDGCTVSQLNEIVLSMENYLSKFDEIESFKTNISSYKSANISVRFKKEIEFTSFPTTLKSNVISKAQDFGGANWVVGGIDERGFNNNVNTSYKEHKIRLLGYNYDQLFRYCKELADSLSLNPRIKGAEIIGDIGWNSSISSSEYYIDYDVEKMALYGLMPYQTYGVLNDLLYSTSVGTYKYGDEKLLVDVVSSQKNSFDVWNLKNSYIKVANKDVKFSNLGSIEKRSTGNDIFRYNQQYSLYVAFDYIGNYIVLSKLIDNNIKRLNSDILPIGYKAEKVGYGGFWDNKKQNIYLIFLVIGIIFFICSVLFESLRYPLIIIGLIPISFIGMFLIFYFTNTSFDQGGFAAMVMLSGLVVNAGIYLLNEFKGQKQIKRYPINLESKTGTVKYYIRAFNHKIIPILLTVLSTLLGLIPFLMDGPKDVFWFAFALGTIGGLVFSLIALILFMPIWIPMKHN